MIDYLLRFERSCSLASRSGSVFVVYWPSKRKSQRYLPAAVVVDVVVVSTTD